MNRAQTPSAHLDQESLFSLEVVVDTLRLDLEKTTCRFPAIAFRLLDFPTLLIYHLEPDIGVAIKNKINNDPHYNLPKQLPELQDKCGHFQVKKGKSCLFKVSANTLQAHLQSTPLYVMIIDVYPETPKLVASCTVSLDTCMNAIYDDLYQNGISVPSAHTERGDYQLCNMMGRNSGNVVLGVRLLSLGVGFLSHLPEKSVAQLPRKSTTTELTTLSPGHIENSDDPGALCHLGITDKTMQNLIVSEKVDCAHLQTQTEQEKLRNATTQTRSQQKPKKVLNEQLRLQSVEDEIKDFLITNTENPPALFFNSEVTMQNAESLVFSHYPEGLPLQRESSSMASESDWDDDSIISKDTVPDRATGNNVHFKAKPKDFIVTQSTVPPQKAPPPQVADSFSNLPILNALLHEISVLQGQTRVSQGAMSKHVIAKTVRDEMGQTHANRNQQKFAKESADDFLSQLSSPRHPIAEKPQLASSTVTRKNTASEVGTKGWLWNQSPSSVPKTKLQYGMTNSQRLRLAKCNPSLLESLKHEEDERLQKSRERMMKKWGKLGVSLNKPVPSDSSADINSREPELRDHGITYSYPVIPRLDLDESTEVKHHKKPVPTPRHSLSARELQEHLEDHSAPPITPRKKRHGTMGTDNNRNLSSEMEVAADSIYDHNSTDDISSTHNPVLGEKYQKRDEQNTGLLYDPEHHSGDSHSAPGFKYSEDFEQHTSVDEMGNKCADEDHDKLNTASLTGLSAGEELGLRCIVDKYSDDSSSQESETSVSYKSARSHTSLKSDNPDDKHTTDPSIVKDQPLSALHPAARSSNIFSGADLKSHSKRQPFTTVSVNDPLSGTQDSTAYIRQSQIASQLSIESRHSVDSAQNRRIHFGRPNPSPRTPRSSRSGHSIRTESVSSYVASDLENTSPVSPASNSAEYSENFDYSDDDDHKHDHTDTCSSSALPKVHSMKDMRVAPEAKLGYTWSGY